MAQMSASDQQLLLKNTRLVDLKSGDILVSPSAKDPLVYFLSSGAVALFVAHHQGQANAGLAVGLVGREGALGLQAAVGMGVGNLTLIVQTQGYAHVLEADRLRQLMKRHPDWLMIFSRNLWLIRLVSHEVMLVPAEAKRLSLALQRWYRCAISLFFAFGGAWLTTQFKQACPHPKCCSTPLTTANASRATASTTFWAWPWATKYPWTRCAL